MWLRVVGEESLKRDHRLAALTYLIVRHSDGKQMEEVRAWARIAGVKESAWSRVTLLGGYIPLRKLDLDAGIYRLHLKLARKISVSLSVQCSSKGGPIRESVAVVYYGNDVRRVLRTCE